ncbi:hypothetical protein VPNG_09659 [Cytospora leucostoma]|uniref:Heterokaryon incompatibility domain-containing protein n=1 Tax=Cytospora leucostoma TaxID=1230097 RepID=A0A423VMH1_9PEZI|nr:hypothetical protein VPNG_09659 [Cytospora leucostoma]
METPYIYDSIEGASSPCCRVLELLPGEFDDDIFVRLRVIQLGNEESEPFEAVSYAWGSAERPHKIYVATNETREGDADARSHYVQVTRNLAQLLRHFRLPDTTRTIWVDAICINQDDTQERSAQVQLMPLLYRTAAHVLVWLGPEEDDSTWALGTFSWWASKVAVDEISGELVLLDSSDPVEDAWMADSRTALSPSSREFTSCRKLIERPWFERVWVRQEIHLSAHKSSVHCGHCSIAWSGLATGIMSLFRRAVDPDTPNRAGYSHRLRLVSDLGYKRHWFFERLIYNVWLSSCLDPRDKVYGILGMLREEEAWIAEALEPDYTISKSHLYRRVFEVSLENGDGLNMMELCLPSRGSKWKPTWLPDWADQGARPEPMLRQRPDLGAAAEVRIVSDELLLLAKGVLYAEVNMVKPSSLKGGPVAALAVEQEIRDIYTTFSPYMEEGVDILETMAYTLSQSNVSEHNIGHTNPYQKHSLVDLKTALGMICIPDGLEDTQVDMLDRLLDHAALSLRNRSIAMTDKGHMVLAPAEAEVGDVLAVLLGSSLLVVLRRKPDDRYQVVGVCHAHGLNWGEGLVGPLPQGWRFVRHWNTTKFYKLWLQDLSTGRVTNFDPRIDWEELEVPEHDHTCDDHLEEWGQGRHFRRPGEAYFRKRGVPLQEFYIE